MSSPVPVDPPEPTRHAIAAYVVAAVPTARPRESAAAARAGLAGGSFASADLVFVLDPDRRLAGVVELTRLLAAPDGTAIADLARADWPTVALTLDREDAASLAIRAGVPGLAAIDGDGRFAGAVPPTALMAILRDEHIEDLHAMAGILHHSEAAKAALTAPPWWRALHRLPWLLVGLAGSVFATAVMARFEAVLTANIAIAFFIPAIVYLADAVGTQSEAVAVRGLSVADNRLLHLVAGELATGLLIGAALALLAWPLVRFGFGDASLAAAVAIALFVAGSAATVIGLLLPLAFAESGFDPAYGSGPLATVIQDVLSLVVYFAIAHALLG